MNIPPLSAWLFIGTGFFLAVGAAYWWYSKSQTRRKRVKGEKRRFYTEGELFMAKIKSYFRRRK